MTAHTSHRVSSPNSYALVGLGSALVVAAVTLSAWHLASPAPRARPAIEPMTAEQCRPLFEAVVSDAIPNVHEDDRVACQAFFADWVRSVPDTPYRVDGKFLEVRGGRFSLVDAKAWRTQYAVGNEQIPSVLVVMDSTAATLRFQNAGDATKALSAIVAAGASVQ